MNVGDAIICLVHEYTRERDLVGRRGTITEFGIYIAVEFDDGRKEHLREDEIRLVSPLHLLAEAAE